MTYRLDCSDCLPWLNSMPEQSVDLCFGSPPYESQRLYLEGGVNIGIARKTEAWVAWMVDVVRASLRVCRGLVAFVVEGQTKNYRYSCGPALLMADLHRAGVTLRKPPIFHRIGIPGSGGPDWLRNDWEWIICATNGGKLPWSDNTACGHPPKWGVGGAMSNRNVEGKRANQTGNNATGKFRLAKAAECRDKFGFTPHDGEPSQTQRANGAKRRRVTSGHKDGDTPNGDSYDPPAIANPGNRIQQTYTAAEVAALLADESDIRHHKVGGGLMGTDAASSKAASANEAPFPEQLAAFFVRSFCPPKGTVIDPFSGSGTTGAVAVRLCRNFLGCDIRQSQVDLAERRIELVTPEALFSE